MRWRHPAVVCLMNAKQALRAGDAVVVKLEFQGGLVLPATFAVRK